jgi:hypothetical protein
MERLWACGGFINMILNSEESGEVSFVKVEQTVVRNLPMSDKAQWMLLCEGDPHDVSQRESNCRTGMGGIGRADTTRRFPYIQHYYGASWGLVWAGQLIRTLLVFSCLTTAIQNRSCLFGMIDLPNIDWVLSESFLLMPSSAMTGLKRSLLGTRMQQTPRAPSSGAHSPQDCLPFYRTWNPDGGLNESWYSLSTGPET